MRRLLRVAVVLLAVAALALAGFGAKSVYERITAAAGPASIPTTTVKRGDVTFTVTAKGELQGGNTEMLSAPMTGTAAVAITFLREAGELVKKGDVVVTFDTTEQEFKLREAEADLAEAGQQVIQAKAESEAKQEEARAALLLARTELRVAEVEMRRNELLSRIAARQNELAVEAARDKTRQLERDFQDRVTAAQAGIAMQEAARAKALVAAETARKNIESMTMKAGSDGYVARQPNMQGNFQYGSYVPAVQVGDTIRPGMAVAQIPDTRNWEVSARVGELDRGHLAEGQRVTLTIVGLPGRTFPGRIKTIGGTSGPPWDRYFECRIAVEQATPELRPGMTARLVITTDTLRKVLWLPAQALFDADGRKYVYLQAGASFTPKDVKLVRRSESRVVVEGLPERQVVALANLDQMKADKGKKGGAMEAIRK